MSAYKDKTGRWRYRFWYNGKRHCGSSPKDANTKKAAEAEQRKKLDQLMERRTFVGKMPTVEAFVDQFLEYQKARVKPLTYELQKTQLEVHVVPFIGKLKLDAVGKRELDHLVTAWQKKAAPRTINTRLGTLMRMFGLAVEWEMLGALPKVSFLKVPLDAPRFLSEVEAHDLLEASQEKQRSDTLNWHSMILVGLKTGLRIGELRGLQWQDIDLVRAVLHVHPRRDPRPQDAPRARTQ